MKRGEEGRARKRSGEDVSGRQRRSGEERRTREEEWRGKNVRRGFKGIDREEKRIGTKRVVCVCSNAHEHTLKSWLRRISKGTFFCV